MGKDEIRNELKEIRFYFSRKKTFDKAFIELGSNFIADKIMKYNDVVKTAPPRLCEVYYSLYIDNNTIESLSEKLGYSYGYIKKLNSRLVDFLFNKINEGGAANV